MLLPCLSACLPTYLPSHPVAFKTILTHSLTHSLTYTQRPHSPPRSRDFHSQSCQSVHGCGHGTLHVWDENLLPHGRSFVEETNHWRLGLGIGTLLFLLGFPQAMFRVYLIFKNYPFFLFHIKNIGRGTSEACTR